MSQAAIRSPVTIYIQEGDVAIFLSLHGELYVGVDVEVEEEVVQLFTSMGPDHEGVINVSELTALLVETNHSLQQ
jgi:Ca2+-binding EF-hand superfamily protein